MPDSRLRQLERRWRQSGDPEDELAWNRERCRAGELKQTGYIIRDKKGLGVIVRYPEFPFDIPVRASEIAHIEKKGKKIKYGIGIRNFCYADGKFFFRIRAPQYSPLHQVYSIDHDGEIETFDIPPHTFEIIEHNGKLGIVEFVGFEDEENRHVVRFDDREIPIAGRYGVDIVDMGNFEGRMYGLAQDGRRLGRVETRRDEHTLFDEYTLFESDTVSIENQVMQGCPSKTSAPFRKLPNLDNDILTEGDRWIFVPNNSRLIQEYRFVERDSQLARVYMTTEQGSGKFVQEAPISALDGLLKRTGKYQDIMMQMRVQKSIPPHPQ